MRRHEATQHVPGGGASHSRREGLRWRRPQRDSAWTRPLQRARRAIASTLGRIEHAGRVIDAAARFGRQRPAAASLQYGRARYWLAGGGTDLDRAARRLQETFVWITLSGVPAGAQEQLLETTAIWLEVAALLANTSNRIATAFAVAHLARRPSDQGVCTLVARHDENQSHLNPAVSISRGRAPPSLFACSL